MYSKTVEYPSVIKLNTKKITIRERNLEISISTKLWNFRTTLQQKDIGTLKYSDWKQVAFKLKVNRSKEI